MAILPLKSAIFSANQGFCGYVTWSLPHIGKLENPVKMTDTKMGFLSRIRTLTIMAWAHAVTAVPERSERRGPERVPGTFRTPPIWRSGQLSSASGGLLFPVGAPTRGHARPLSDANLLLLPPPVGQLGNAAPDAWVRCLRCACIHRPFCRAHPSCGQLLAWRWLLREGPGLRSVRHDAEPAC